MMTVWRGHGRTWMPRSLHRSLSKKPC